MRPRASRSRPDPARRRLPRNGRGRCAWAVRGEAQHRGPWIIIGLFYGRMLRGPTCSTRRRVAPALPTIAARRQCRPNRAIQPFVRNRTLLRVLPSETGHRKGGPWHALRKTRIGTSQPTAIRKKPKAPARLTNGLTSPRMKTPRCAAVVRSSVPRFSIRKSAVAAENEMGSAT